MKWPKLDGIIAIFLIILLLAFNSLVSANQEEAFQLDRGRISSILNEVTSKTYSGHIAGSEGNEKLATYIHDQFIEMSGEASTLSVDYSPFKMIAIEADPLAVLKIGREGQQEEYINLKDYRVIRNAYSGNIDYQGDLVFIKGRIVQADEALVKGKVIITDLNANQSQSIEVARQKGIRGIIYAQHDPPTIMNNRSLNIGEKISDDLFMANIPYTSFKTIEKKLKENNTILSASEIKLEDHYRVVEGNNIVALIQGKNPMKEMYFVTHYDGKGMTSEGYYPGASRNGSAISLLIELAEMIVKTGIQPEYSIGFVFLDGHELGNVGAKNFLSTRIDKSKSQEFIVVNDLGLSNNNDLYLNSRSTSINATQEGSMLHSKVATVAADAGIAVKRYGGSFSSEGIFKGTSAAYLAQAGLPVVELKSFDTVRGIPKVYTIEDTVEVIDLDKVMTVAKLLKHYTYREAYDAFDLSYLKTNEKYLINVSILSLLFLTIMGWAYRKKPEFQIFGIKIRDIVLSIPYSVFTKVLAIIIPTLMMLFLMVLVLSIPYYTSSSTYGVGFDNYLPHIHLKNTISYCRLLVSGDLGTMNPTVIDAMIKGAVKSFRLLSVSLVGALVIGISLGLLNGLKRSSIRTFFGLLVFSIPDVIISLGALYSIVYFFKDIFISPGVLRTVVMPTFAMIVVPAIYIARIIEVAVIEERDQAYIYGALSRGASKRAVIWRHIFPKVLSKLFDAMGTVIRIAIINLIVVEYIFSSVGIGNYLMTNYRDAFFVIYISFGFGAMYFALTQFFKLLSWRLNPMKRKVSS